MSDRELRLFHRRQKRYIIMRRRCIMAFLTVGLILLGTVCYQSIKSSASTSIDNLNFKYYTNITVEQGETLWEISDRYIDYAQYRDKEEYITEVCRINHLNTDGSIRSGQKLLVPYYSNKFIY